MLDYIRDGQEIYRQSFATIRAEANLSRIPADLEKLAVRVIHACGMIDVVEDLQFSEGAGAAGRTALAQGAPILCDAGMVAQGITRARLPANNEVICTLTHPDVPALGARTRQYPLGGRARIVAAASGRQRRRDRQCADRPLSSARYARCRCAKARADPRLSGRFRRRGRIESDAGRRQPRRALRRGSRTTRRQRDGRRRSERARDGGRINDRARTFIRTRRRPRRPGTHHAESAAFAESGTRGRVFRREGQEGQRLQHHRGAFA